MSTTIKPFRIEIHKAALDDLKTRLQQTRWANELPGGPEDYGITLKFLKKLTEYWQKEYNWHEVESSLNKLPQFTTEIDGQTVHFVHVRSNEANATPIILTHGWPCSFVEYVKLIDPLVNPVAHGGKAEDAFDVVIPSIPGIGFSGPTTTPGWSRYRIAKAWVELMKRLGYDSYLAAGNDGGSQISPEVGRLDPEHCKGVHVTQIFSFPSGDPEEFKKLSPEDMKKLEMLQWFNDTMSGFSKLQSTKPQTLAHALADSPVGQLAWSCQLFGDAVSQDFAITNVMIYWLTNTAASAARFYYEDAHAKDVPKESTTTPIGLANFAFDFQSIRTFAERDHKRIVSWNVYDKGGHFPTEMTPDLYLDDIRKFAKIIRDL